MKELSERGYNTYNMRKFLLFIFIFFVMAHAPHAFAQNVPANSKPVTFEGVVTKVVEQNIIIEDSGNKHPYQKLEVLKTTGTDKGKSIIVENGKYDQSGIITYGKGDKIVISLQKSDRGDDLFTITDYVRRLPLYILLTIFVVLAIIIGGKRGLSSLIGMIVTFSLLFIFVLPQVLNGASPVLVTVIASFFIIPITFFLSHGMNKKTICAILGTFISLSITGILASIFVNSTHLSGYASEESNYLDVMKHGSINMHELLLAGIIIGLLGVLQDITISQAAVVYQLKNANKKLKFHELYLRAMDVGRDHIASMANTLILVYAGVSLPLLLLFINNPLPFSQIINFEIISEEIVRTLIASIGLIIAVPITTLLTALYVAATQKRE